MYLECLIEPIHGLERMHELRSTVGRVGSELHSLMTEDLETDLSPPWDDREDELVALFSGFLHKAAAIAKH